MNPMPATGQVWESTDTRDGGRLLFVAYVGTIYVSMRNTTTGRRSFIQMWRMRRSLGDRGYRLVVDVG